MADKISVESGNPYRDSSGHFGTSPDKALADSFKALQGKTFIPKASKSKDGKSQNRELIESFALKANKKLAELRGETSPQSTDLPDTKIAKKGTVYYHGTSADDVDSLIADGFNPSASKGKGEGEQESPYALFVSTRATGDDDHSAGSYGDGTVVEVTATRDLVLLDGLSQTWSDTMGRSKGADDSARIAKELQDQGYDGIDEGSGEVLLWNNDSFTISLPEKKQEQQFGMGIRKATNANITPDEQRQIDLATEQFKQAVQRVDNQVLAKYIQAVQDGDYAKAEAILAEAVESQQTQTLYFALLTIGAILLPLYAKQRLQALFVQFGLNTVFGRTRSGEDAMKLQAKRGAQSHVRTIAKDIKNNLDDAIDNQITNPDIEAQLKDKYEELNGKENKALINAVKQNKKIYKFARDAILAGESRQAVIQSLQETFSEVGRKRANVIAGNEANRVFTMSQYDADQQFLAQNNLTEKAYKRLVSNTGHPEAICAHIIRETAANPIPFTQDFVPFGNTLTVTDNGKTYKFKANYEKLRSGHIHVNCHCRYELLIKQDDGTFFNTYDGKVINDLFDEKKHKRDKDGKFAKKASLKELDLSRVDDVNDFNSMVEAAYFDGSMGHHAEEVTESVRAYQGHFYDAINIHARSNMLDDPLVVYGRETTYGDTINNINAAANMQLSSNVLVYRGTEIPHHQLVDVGDKMDARSFLSTSIDQDVAKTFQYPGGSMFVITAKKGQKVIIPDYVTYGKRGRTMGEAEVLMPTDSTLTITKIEGDTVYAELN